MDRRSGMRALPSPGGVRRITRLVSLSLVSVCASCGSSLERSSLVSFLEAVQRPFDLTGVTLLGVPAEPPAHLLLSALLAGLLAWWWRPLGTTVLIGALALVARGRRPAGRFIELPLPATGSTAQRDGREAAATILLSATPGSLVVYSDPEHSRIRLHTLPLPESALQRAVRDPDRRR